MSRLCFVLDANAMARRFFDAGLMIAVNPALLFFIFEEEI